MLNKYQNSVNKAYIFIIIILEIMQLKKLLKGVFAADLALYLEKSKTLIIADTHIGYEESLNKQGILLPRFQFKEIGQRLEKIFRALKEKNLGIEKIIINGDIKHEFGRISEQEWRHTLQLIDFLAKHCKELILIRGNHDTILGPIAEKRDLIVKEHYLIDNILVMHGDRLMKKDIETKAHERSSGVPKQGFVTKKAGTKIETIIIGHEHPAVSLGSMARFEKYKCFLVGKWKSRKLIVQPSFNLVTEGTDVLKESLLSPFLKGNKEFKNFEAIVVGEDDKFYDFGKLKNLNNDSLN